MVEVLRELIGEEEFKSRHKSAAKYFTRSRKLGFASLIGLLLRKGMKSLQLMLNEWSLLEAVDSVSNSAFVQARSHLRHTAFIELNQKSVVEVLYRDEDAARFKGWRLLGLDGSKVVLPDSADTIKAFGQIDYKNKTVQGKRTYGMASVLYDVLNKVALDSQLASAHAYEVDMAIDHLGYTDEKDLIIADRGYASYRFLSTLLKHQRDFVIRCSSGSFGVAQAMLKGLGSASQLASLRVPADQKKVLLEAGLSESIQVRFVRIRLKTGEDEVLVTSLLDEREYAVEDLSEIYRLRWEIEGFYGLLKTRLNLENFTGKSAESVRQDFYSTIYLTGLESILTADSDSKLAEKAVQHPQQVNKAVSFNAIKNQAFALLYSDEATEVVIEKLARLFLTNPIACRNERQVPRQKRSDNHLLNFSKRKRKICF